MKIAITSIDNTDQSKMDPRFGRCVYFAIYDDATTETVFYSNPNKDVAGGAGPASAQFLASRDVEMVVSGDFGGKVKDVFNQLKIKMVVKENTDITVAQIIESIKN